MRVPIPRTTSLRKAIALLTTLGSEDAVQQGGYGVSRLAEVTGQEVSQVSRTLRALAEAGLVDRDSDTRSYRLGWRIFALAARAGDQRLLSAAGPILTQLVRDTGERSHLCVLRGTEVLTLMTEAPSHAIQTVTWVGRVVCSYATSSGRSLLLDHDKEQLTTLLGGQIFHRHGPNTPADIDELYARILMARRRGVAVLDEEFEPGLMAVSAPVRDFRGRIVAALNISGPGFRLGDVVYDAAVTVSQAARRLSGHLGRAQPDLQLTAL